MQARKRAVGAARVSVLALALACAPAGVFAQEPQDVRAGAEGLAAADPAGVVARTDAPATLAQPAPSLAPMGEPEPAKPVAAAPAGQASESADVATAKEPAALDTQPTGSIANPEKPVVTPSEGQVPTAPVSPPQPAATVEAPSAAPGLPAVNVALKAALDTRAPLDAKRSAGAELRKQHEAIAAFYAARDFAPLWSLDGAFTPAARAILARLDHAADDGLDLRATPVPAASGHSDEERAAADLALSDAVVAYARQATGSRVDPHMISHLIDTRPNLADMRAVLADLSAADSNAGDVLREFNPPQAGYKALRDKLAEMRQEHAPVARAPIPAGPDLKVGMRDPRVSLIRARFNLDGQPSTSPEDLLYDTRVAAAVADFQKTRGLPASGVLTARTIAALSGGQPSRLENEILSNMERWRWMPRDMGASRIEVNVPDFTVTVIKDGQAVLTNRVVVGKEDTPTPIFSNKMQFLIVNPYWNVPQSIIKKEMLPRIAQDPDYLKRLGYEVVTKGDKLIVRQPPGERNALGRIKFMFPNDYAVYLHDTPSRALFGNARRAYSHGCVRVDQPFSFAEAVLGRDNGWNEGRVKKLIGGGERYVYLPKPLPIHIEYFTASVDDTGRLRLRDDVYGYSHRVTVALGLER